MDYLSRAKQFVVTDLQSIIDEAFRSVLGSVPEYDVLIWGSTIRENVENPTDLDVLIAVREASLSDDEIESIEGIIKSRAIVDEFSYVDAWVTPDEEVVPIIENSRVSRVYNVSENTWEEF